MGLLYCDCVGPDDDVVKLDQDNQALAEPRPRPPDPGGSIDGHDYDLIMHPPFTGLPIVGAPSNYKP